MPRENIRHTPESLDRLVKELKEVAGDLERIAARLRESTGEKSISLAFQQTADKGLQALRRMCLQADLKLVQLGTAHREPEKEN